MPGFVATPEWERFTGWVQGSSVAWAEAHEGLMGAINRAQANNNFASLNIHPGSFTGFVSLQPFHPVCRDRKF